MPEAVVGGMTVGGGLFLSLTGKPPAHAPCADAGGTGEKMDLAATRTGYSPMAAELRRMNEKPSARTREAATEGK